MMHQDKQAMLADEIARHTVQQALPPHGGASTERPGVLPALLALAVAGLLTGCAAAPTPTAPEAAAKGAGLGCTLDTNCVSSVGSAGLPPLRYRGTLEEGKRALKTTLAGFAEARIVREGASDIGTMFTTPSGFRDEVDFSIDPSAGRIDFRSRSLLGLFDFGKNRARMLEFAARFARQPAAVPANPG